LLTKRIDKQAAIETVCPEGDWNRAKPLEDADRMHVLGSSYQHK